MDALAGSVQRGLTMGKKSETVGYKTYYFGKWEKHVDNGQPMLRCPECECGIRWDAYKHAIGTKGMSFCPYCGADLREPEK